MLNSITHPRTPVKSPQRWILRKAIADLRNTAGEVNAHTKAHKQTLCKCLVCPEAFELGKSERNEKQLAGSPKSRQKSALLFMADMRKYMTVRTRSLLPKGRFNDAKVTLDLKNYLSRELRCAEILQDDD